MLPLMTSSSVLPKNIGEKISGAAKVLRVPTKQQRRQSAIQQVVSGSHLLSCYIHFLSGSEPCCNHLHGYCGHTTDHCLCLNCKNYHFLFLHVLAILFGLALTGIIAGGMIAFGIYKYKNWTAEKQRAVARDKEEKRRKEEEKNEAEV